MSKITLLILTIFFAFGCNHNKQVKPNIVLIMTDDLNDYNEDLMGHPQVISPNIKKLADSGISFINALFTSSFLVTSNDPTLETTLPGRNFNELGFGVISV